MRLTLLTTLTMVAFAANSILNRMAVADGLIGAEAFALVRVVAGAVMLAILIKGQGLMQRPSIWGVLGLSAYLVGFSQAYIGLDAGLGALILFGMVQVTMFGGALQRGEALPAQRWLGMAIAFGGLALVMLQGVPAGAGAQIGVLFMALAGIGWGIYSLVGQKVTDPLAATARSFLWSVPLVGLASFGASFQAMPSGVALAILSGAVTSGLGYALWYSVLPQLGAARAAVAQLTVPLIAIAAGAALLGEQPDRVFLIGSVLVLVGVAVSVLARSHRA